MSIHVYTGVPGSGKSLHAARDIREQLVRRYPRPVISNFPLSESADVPDDVRDLYTYIPNNEMTAGKIIDFCDSYWRDSDRSFQEDYILLVLDECQLLFNSRLWAQGDRMSYLQFLSQSRKYGVRVVLISQNTKMIDNQFRMLIEEEHNHRRLSKFGFLGWVVNLFSFSQCFVVVRTLYQLNEPLGFDFIRMGRHDISMYDSYTTFDRTSED